MMFKVFSLAALVAIAVSMPTGESFSASLGFQSLPPGTDAPRTTDLPVITRAIAAGTYSETLSTPSWTTTITLSSEAPLEFPKDTTSSSLPPVPTYTVPSITSDAIPGPST